MWDGPPEAAVVLGPPRREFLLVDALLPNAVDTTH